MITAEHPHLFVDTITHPGMKGKLNEDCYAVAAHKVSENDPVPSLFLVIADGVGGHRAGEVASQIAVNQITQTIASSDGKRPVDILGYALSGASQAVLDAAQADEERQGMGATVVCAWILEDRLYASWMGDSRMYLIRNGEILQLTTDHTWIQEALDHGILTPDQVPGHPNVHVIHRHLGSKKRNEPDFRLRSKANEKEGSDSNQGMQILPGDRLLLCTDGLTDLVMPDEIYKAVTTLPRGQALQGLVNMANARGGHDNITVILAEVPSQARDADSSKSRQSMPLKIAGISCFVILLAFLILIVFGTLLWYFYLM